MSSMIDNKINLVCYGKVLKKVVINKGIDENTVPKVESVIHSI